MEDRDIETTHATLRATVHGKGPQALMLIHGNSSTRTIFKHMLASQALAVSHMVIAADLPGHGDSSNARDPDKSYTQGSYADALLQLLRALHITDATLLGWSLGGHIAIEMAPRAAAHGIRIRAAMLIGTPPVNAGEMARAFKIPDDAGADAWRRFLGAREDLGEEELEQFARLCADPPYEAWMGAAVRRTHQCARRVMFEDVMRPGSTLAQRTIVETRGDVLWAVVNGKQEPWMDMAVLEDIKFANLWRGQCLEIEDSMHAPFWAQPQSFEVLLRDFIKDAQD